MSKTKGRVTLPSEANFLKETEQLLERWGADAIRDSDGTKLPQEVKNLNAKIYTTYFVSRGHNEFAQEHLDERQQMYLMSKHQIAVSETLDVDFMDGYFDQQIQPDYVHDPKVWWEVMDRTIGKPVPVTDWEVDTAANLVHIHAVPFHDYTVSFLADALWDPTQMYNHITNQWGDRPHDIPFDVRCPLSGQYAKDCLRQWLKENPDTDVVRFTTFFYHFALLFNHLGQEKFVDWFGYGSSVSVEALKAFEAEYGYALRPEDFVDEGYYNTAFRVPTPHYLDYMDFIQRFVAQKAKELVEIVHEAGREAMMFLGDNWIGTEPYGMYFKDIGLDAVVGSVGGGATLRLISEIPHVSYTEGRFLPYFFPDTFCQGGDPCGVARESWLTARRAILRKPVDRIGYGGYLSLAYKFPDFVEYIEKVTDEFRLLYDNIQKSEPYTGLTVGILNCWGQLRAWQAFMVAHALWYKQTYSYFGILEALSGMAVEVKFLSFEDIRKNGVPQGIDVLLNAGDGGTAFSGGSNWLDPEVVCNIREWVHHGGGFIGLGDPSFAPANGHSFQLADVLGVDKELGFSLSTDKYFHTPLDIHFITQDCEMPIDFGESMKNVYATAPSTDVIVCGQGDLYLAAHQYGAGRGVYLAGLPYSIQNTRLLLRTLFYAASREEQLKKWYADNPACEVHAYPKTGKFAVVNNTMSPQKTTVYDGQGIPSDMTLEPCEIRWDTFQA